MGSAVDLITGPRRERQDDEPRPSAKSRPLCKKKRLKNKRKNSERKARECSGLRKGPHFCGVVKLASMLSLTTTKLLNSGLTFIYFTYSFTLRLPHAPLPEILLTIFLTPQLSSLPSSHFLLARPHSKAQVMVGCPISAWIAACARSDLLTIFVISEIVDTVLPVCPTPASKFVRIAWVCTICLYFSQRPACPD